MSVASRLAVPPAIASDVDAFIDTVRLNAGGNEISQDLAQASPVEKRFQIDAKSTKAHEIHKLAAAARDKVESNVVRLAVSTRTKIEESIKTLDAGLKDRAKEHGASYALGFLDQFARRMQEFRTRQDKEIESLKARHESQAELVSQKEDEIERQSQKGWPSTLRLPAMYGAYGVSLSEELRLRDEILRCDKSQEVLLALRNAASTRRSQMGLPEVEQKLNRVKGMIDAELLPASDLPKLYGEYTMIVSPDVTIVGRGEHDTYENLRSYLEDINALPSFDQFLRERGLALDDISEMTEQELKERIAAYSQAQVCFVWNEGHLDAVWRCMIGRPDAGKDRVMFTLREASDRAAPRWLHETAGDRAAMMEQFLLLGVEDRNATFLNDPVYLQSICTADRRRPPTLTSTNDPSRVSMFTYEAPLPAYLLQDLKVWRREYLAIPCRLTVHTESDAEMKIPDLLPQAEVYKRNMRLFALASVPGLAGPNSAFIRKRTVQGATDKMIDIYDIDDVRVVRVVSEELELGNSVCAAFETFCMTGHRDLRSVMTELLDAELKPRLPATQRAIGDYANALKKEITERYRSLVIGDRMLLHEEVRFLEDYLSFLRGDSSPAASSLVDFLNSK